MTGSDPGGAPRRRSPRSLALIPRPLPAEFQLAFDECYREVTALASKIALASMDAAAAAGIAEDVGIALWRRWSAEPAVCAADRDWGAWTASAVRTKAINRIVRRVREAAITDDDQELDEVAASQWETPDRIYELHELMDVIQASIAGTSRRTREVFIASREPGATVASVAALVGIPQRNVRYYVGAGLKVVREAVHRYNGQTPARRKGRGPKPSQSDPNTHPEHWEHPEAE